MTKSRHRRAEMVRFLALRDTEGLTFEALARRTGVPAGTLSWWSHHLKHEAETDIERGFIELVDVDTPVPEASKQDDADALLSVRLPSGTIFEFGGAAALLAAERILRGSSSWS